jgi:hypothetical protein
MSLAEKLYLVMVVSMFVSFGVLLATLSWLDSREEKAAQWNDRKKTMAVQRNKNVSQPMGHSPALTSSAGRRCTAATTGPLVDFHRRKAFRRATAQKHPTLQVARKSKLEYCYASRRNHLLITESVKKL